VVAGNLRLYVLIAGLALYLAALFFPAIVFKPDPRSNPKLGECGFAVKDNVLCEAFAFGGSGSTLCQRVEGNASGKSFVERRRILEYCKGWDLPVAGTLYGYQILPMGVLGFFSACSRGSRISRRSSASCCRRSGNVLPRRSCRYRRSPSACNRSRWTPFRSMKGR
jgi:hypothetical protein